MNTVWQWIYNKEFIKVCFDSNEDRDGTLWLTIMMTVAIVHTISTEKEEIIPISIEYKLKDDEIPTNDDDMIEILDGMFQKTMSLLNDFKK